MQDFEWLILDDGPEPSPFFSTLDDRRVRYQHRSDRLTTGAKRNLLIERAASDILIHLDDDDYHAPRYLETMAARLNAGADIAKFSGFYVYSVPFRALGYWDLLANQAGLHHQLSPLGVAPVHFPTEPEGLRGVRFGFYLAFRKSVWTKEPFEERTHGEDGLFVMAARDGGFKIDMFPDSEGLSLHILRRDNNSQCFPQYLLPEFLLDRIFGPAVQPMLTG